MRFFFGVLAVFAMSGCYWSSMGFHSGGVEYSQDGLMGAGPVEAAAADLTSAQADLVRAEARTMEAHPELFLGYRGYGGYGYGGGYGRVDPSYYYPSYGSSPAPETRATGLEQRATGLEEEARELEDLLREHIEEERSQP